MGGLTRIGGALIGYFCVATVITLAAGGAYLFTTGTLSPEQIDRILAVLHGVETPVEQTAAPTHKDQTDEEQPSLEMIERLRSVKLRDFELRERATEEGLSELKSVQRMLQEEREGFFKIKSAFDEEMKLIGSERKEQGILEVQRLMELMKPKQAKEQILKMLEDGKMDAVMQVLKTMNDANRKKILAEFKESDDFEKLHDILKRIQEQESVNTLIDKTKKALNK